MLSSPLGWCLMVFPLGLSLFLLLKLKERTFSLKKATIGGIGGFLLPYTLIIAEIMNVIPPSMDGKDPFISSGAMLLRALCSAASFAIIFGLYRKSDSFILKEWLTKNPKKTINVMAIIAVAIMLFAINPLLLLLAASAGIIVIYLKRQSASIVKNKPDVLGEDFLGDSIRKDLNNSEGVWCGQQGGVDLWVTLEDRAVVIGPPGTGKTAFLITQLLKWAETRRPFICLDIKPEIYGITRQALEEKGYDIITYNPSSQTGHRYNLLADLYSPEAIGELATNLIPSPNPEDAVFHENARDFLDAIITHCKAIGEGSLPQLMDFVSQFDHYRDLFKALLQSPAPDTVALAKGLSIVAANERMLGSIFATFRSNLRFLRYPAIRASLAHSDFSLKAFTEKRPVALFLQFEERHQELTSRLLSMMVNHILRYLIEHRDREPVLMQLDEIGNAPIIQNLPQKLNTIRSRHIPLWLYWQGLSQMQKYGQKMNEGVDTILGACDFQMVFRLNDNASAEWMSKRLHLVDIEIISQSVSHRGFNITNTHSKTLIKEPALFAQELQRLDEGEAVCVYRKKAWRAKAMPYFVVYPEFLNIRPSPEDSVAASYS